MKIEKYLNNKRYLLSNENLKEGDKVYPIAQGRITDDGEWILHALKFEENLSGFPYDPHTILNIEHSTYKPYEVHTDKGYSPIECYYKIIRIEKRIIKKRDFGEGGLIFNEINWEELKIT